MDLYIAANKRGKKMKNGEKYYEEFKTGFWKKPSNYHHFLLFESYVTYEK
jgi:hypothetical protein